MIPVQARTQTNRALTQIMKINYGQTVSYI